LGEGLKIIYRPGQKGISGVEGKKKWKRYSRYKKLPFAGITVSGEN